MRWFRECLKKLIKNLNNSWLCQYTEMPSCKACMSLFLRPKLVIAVSSREIFRQYFILRSITMSNQRRVQDVVGGVWVVLELRHSINHSMHCCAMCCWASRNSFHTAVKYWSVELTEPQACSIRLLLVACLRCKTVAQLGNFSFYRLSENSLQ